MIQRTKETNGRLAKRMGRNISALLLIVLAVSTVGFPAACNYTGEGSIAMANDQQRVRAPEFPSGLEWLNTSAPLSLKELKGKVVLLDFWTYCCINCIHIMPDLKKLEAKYADELVVIGVHSAKFLTEQETDNIRQAVLRYELEHPVVNDNRMRIWQAYGARAWPTLMLIDPEGYLVGYHSGEGIYDIFDRAISEQVEKFDAKGGIDRTPLAKLYPEKNKERRTLLQFPGKVLADEKSGRLFIADSNHNRIVVVSLADNSVLEIIGNGESGFEDGDFDSAKFNKPQGMALDGTILYVADTENHAVRAIDFGSRKVTTIAGTGQQAAFMTKPGPALSTSLNSPWDLVLNDDVLFIANAGSHQLWRLNLENGVLEPHAGSGRENRFDGSLASSALAQPSGLSTDGRLLYFADSEVSAIRSASIDPAGEVKTIAGGELFEFGDNEASGLKARFQHPLGVVFNGGNLYVADTYNNKIKLIDLDSGRSTTFLGSGEEGMVDGAWKKATFDEPGGLSIADGKLYIADTNNHLIRVADLKSRTVETLVIREMEKLKVDWEEDYAGDVEKLAVQQVKPGAATLEIALELPEGMKLTPTAPSSVVVKLGDAEPQLFKDPVFPLSVPFEANGDSLRIQLDYTLYYCNEGNEGLCFFKGGRVELPLQIGATAAGEKASLTLEPDKNMN